MYSFILSAIENDYASTIELLKEAQKAKFDGVLLDNNLAYAYLNFDKVKEAEAILKKYINNPVPPVLIPTMGMLEIRKGNIEKGNDFYRKAVEIFSNNAKTTKELNVIWRYEQALYWHRQREFHKAEELLKEARTYGKTYFSSEISKFEKTMLTQKMHKIT